MQLMRLLWPGGPVCSTIRAIATAPWLLSMRAAHHKTRGSTPRDRTMRRTIHFAAYRTRLSPSERSMHRSASSVAASPKRSSRSTSRPADSWSGLLITAYAPAGKSRTPRTHDRPAALSIKVGRSCAVSDDNRRRIAGADLNLPTLGQLFGPSFWLRKRGQRTVSVGTTPLRPIGSGVLTSDYLDESRDHDGHDKHSISPFHDVLIPGKFLTSTL